MAASFAFEQFVLDTAERRLLADNQTVELNGRYFDALALLVREQGRLVSKDRFLTEVWRGVPVTDEALTQCIRTLRRQLRDDAAQPRFIETVPKHGYRFIASVAPVDRGREQPLNDAWSRFALIGSAGTIGGAIAGLIGGLFYGFAGASAQHPGAGALSILLVMLCVTLLVAVIGAAGVSFAIATAEFAPTHSLQWLVVAGGGGGLVTGAVVKLVGLDAFALLTGHAPGDITGAMEGALIGSAVGLGACLAQRTAWIRRGATLAACAGALAGIAIVLLGVHLLLGSVASLTQQFPGSSLRLDGVAQIFGETQPGPVTQLVTAALEGALFSGCVVAAMQVARRRGL